ncbi:MAG: hypothetical protein ACK578_08665 [Pirellula sp.]
MHYPIRTLVFALITALLCCQEVLLAQKANREIRVQETFEPSFRIEPLMHRISGRSGDVIPFEFTLESSNQSTNVEVFSVGLRQEITGGILHDEDSTQVDWVRLVTPNKLSLEANKSTKIEGVVRIPAGEAKHFSMGIMVRDLGNQAPNNASDPSKTQATIRFITQYMLRLDLEVEGARGDQIQRIIVEDLKIVSHQGRPLIQAILSNPTDTTFEFEIRSKISTSPNERSAKPIRLAMPIRWDVEDDSRFAGRILPKSKIRMEEFVSEALATGTYEIETEIFFEKKVSLKKTYSIKVAAEEFPAQEVLIAQIAEGLQASPAQLELSQARGGNRRLILEFKNRSKTERTVALKAIGLDGLAMTAAMIQPSDFSIPANATRKVTLTLKGQSKIEQAADYGFLSVETRAANKDFTESRQLPLALVYKKVSKTTLAVAPLVWDPNGKYPGFRTTVENTGDNHMPVEARLSLVSEGGVRLQSLAGFGKWLMPKAKESMLFRIDQPLLPGKYTIKCEIQTGEKPIVFDQELPGSDVELAKPSPKISSVRP